MEKVTFADYPDCVRLANADAEIVISTAFGPRILRYGLLGGPNVFALCSDLSKDLGDGTQWKPYGGHRLWVAPEAFPRSYFSDNSPVGSVTSEGQGVRLTNSTEHTTGLQKELIVTLAAQGPAARVAHIITNRGPWAVTVSAWALSIVANGGYAVLPQEAFASHDDDLLPARPVVIWPFTDMADPRWRWGTKYITLHQHDTPKNQPQKVGIYNKQGWAAHVTPAQAFVVHIPPADGGPQRYPDQGSNFETYTDGPFQELETLSPLTLLEPGQSVTLVEDWYLAALPNLADTDDTLDTHLLPLVSRARAAAL